MYPLEKLSKYTVAHGQQLQHLLEWQKSAQDNLYDMKRTVNNTKESLESMRSGFRKTSRLLLKIPRRR
jgi:hypothetical protein